MTYNVDEAIKIVVKKAGEREDVDLPRLMDKYKSLRELDDDKYNKAYNKIYSMLVGEY